MRQRHVKVAVTGAAGNIGYATIFRLASGQVFGPDVTIDLHLLEVANALPALQGVVMELEDCAFPLLRNVKISHEPDVAFDGINWALLIGAMPRRQGMERSDLLQENGKIFGPQGKALNRAADNVRAFVVGNPCNTNCLIAMHAATDVPNDRFFAMTMLDQNRAKAQLAMKVDVPVTDVKNMIIWGNHSSTQYPDFYNSSIQGKAVTDLINERWLIDKFIPTIQQRGAEVIKARGASSAASAANAAINTVQALVNPTPSDDSFSVSLCSQGQYGVDEGLIFSFPCRTDGETVEIIEDISHNQLGQEKIKITLDELRTERDMVKKLGFIK